MLTPILPVPLEGPAYFVSHGGEAFPSVIFVLQGYGVTIDVVSTTFISKAGITSATLKAVPDAPFTSFELTFPEKQYSALAANGNLCNVKGGLKMPTEFIAQNGLKIKQSTKITVTGCAKKKTLTRAQKLAAALKACARRRRTSARRCVGAARRSGMGRPRKTTRRRNAVPSKLRLYEWAFAATQPRSARRSRHPPSDSSEHSHRHSRTTELEHPIGPRWRGKGPPRHVGWPRRGARPPEHREARLSDRPAGV